MKNKLTAVLKKIKYYLQLIDGVWSVPLAFGAFWFIGVGMQTLFGYETGFYDVAFIQPLFLAAAVVIGATNIAVGGIYFTFRGLYRFLYGEKNKQTGEIVNYSKYNWKSLTSWQRFLITLFVFFYYVTATIVVYLKLV
jgi:hypothetical protein